VIAITGRVTDVTEAKNSQETGDAEDREGCERRVILKLSGRMEPENVGELETLFSAETNGHRIVLDLEDLTLVDQDLVSFLRRCQADNIQLKNCPAYIRE